MAKTKLEVASDGPAYPATSIVAARNHDTYRLSFLAEDGQRLAHAVSLSRAQVMALAGMLSALLDGADPHAVAID